MSDRCQGHGSGFSWIWKCKTKEPAESARGRLTSIRIVSIGGVFGPGENRPHRGRLQQPQGTRLTEAGYNNLVAGGNERVSAARADARVPIDLDSARVRALAGAVGQRLSGSHYRSAPHDLEGMEGQGRGSRCVLPTPPSATGNRGRRRDSSPSPGTSLPSLGSGRPGGSAVSKLAGTTFLNLPDCPRIVLRSTRRNPSTLPASKDDPKKHHDFESYAIRCKLLYYRNLRRQIRSFVAPLKKFVTQ
jgi:hypothetical protein